MSLFHALATRSLRALPAEMAHTLTIEALRAGLGPRAPGPDDPILRTRFAGLDLPNPIGLAAGFDKNAHVGAAMLAAGFGWAESGTVTPLPQAGNAHPRLFRLPHNGAVINRMGFNNKGAEAFAAAFEKQRALVRTPGALGANIGANKTSADRAGDYCLLLTRLWGLADWFTVNISSPNTPNLRDLQTGAALDELLERLMHTRKKMQNKGGDTPLFLKVAPDLDARQIDNITEAAIRHGIDALIVANTTISRPADLRGRARGEKGGLSGAPLFDLSTRILRQFHAAAGGRIPLVGVGGIASGGEAYAKIRAGASAVQLYTAMVYHGPALVQTIKADLAARLKADGFANIMDAVGQ